MLHRGTMPPPPPRGRPPQPRGAPPSPRGAPPSPLKAGPPPPRGAPPRPVSFGWCLNCIFVLLIQERLLILRKYS